MNIYEFANRDNQAYLRASNETCLRCMPDPPQSLKSQWLTPTFELITSDESGNLLPISDFPSLTIATIVLSARAINQLHSFLGACGEVLPIALSNRNEQFFLFNVTSTLDAVDMPRSDFLRFPDGRVMAYKRLVFDRAKIPREPLFFKTTQLGPITEIFATEEAVAAVEQAGLTGYEFRLAGTDR